MRGSTDGDVAAPRWVETTPPGSSLLVAGEPMVGKRGVLYELLAAHRGPTGGTVLATTNKPAATVVGEYREVHPDQADGLLTVVDAVGDGGAPTRTDGWGQRPTSKGATVVRAGGPGDLTGIGIYATEAARRLGERADVDGIRVGLHSLSPMLAYADEEHIYQFLHVVTGHLGAAGCVSAFVIDERPGTRRLNTLVGPFDGLVEVRDDGSREVRVRGTPLGPDDWTAF